MTTNMKGEVKSWQTLPPEDEVWQNRCRLNDPPRKNWWSEVGAVAQSTGEDLVWKVLAALEIRCLPCFHSFATKCLSICDHHKFQF